MKQKRNRERIMEQSLYDLLCKMNERAMPDKCVLQLLDEKKDFRNPRCERYDCGNFEIGCMNNCTQNYVCCKQCIADWLNEFPF